VTLDACRSYRKVVPLWRHVASRRRSSPLLGKCGIPKGVLRLLYGVGAIQVRLAFKQTVCGLRHNTTDSITHAQGLM
jgi:hypothetical protein